MNLKKFDVSIRRCIDKILKDESILDVKVENVVYHPIKGDDLYLWEIKCLRFDEGILNSKNIPLKLKNGSVKQRIYLEDNIPNFEIVKNICHKIYQKKSIGDCAL